MSGTALTDLLAQGHVEQFGLIEARTVELVPGEDDVEAPQLGLVLIGRPPHFADRQNALKVYMTYLAPAIAVQLGPAITEAGEAMAAHSPASTSGLVTASPADMHSVAAQADLAQGLRRT